MAYKKIKSYALNEEQLRQLWYDEYCKSPIFTFDNVLVKFYENMFDHAFFESKDRKRKDKSILSLNRCEKMLWIKDTLQDPNAILKQGWDNENKSYYENRRVALVKGNYVVIIRFTGLLKASFVTAYEKEDLSNIINSPDFKRMPIFFGDKA